MAAESITAKEYFEQDRGTGWVNNRARMAFPILFLLAESGEQISYQELDKAIAEQFNQNPTPNLIIYGQVLIIIGQALNLLSQAWGEEIPPLTILVVSKTNDIPSPGVDEFLKRYLSSASLKSLTAYNREAMIDRAKQAVHNYPRWDDVAEYFDVDISTELPETEPIQLPSPPLMMGGESQAHLALKQYVSEHPELFKAFGHFEKGAIEFPLKSGDEVDILFKNADQALAVEIKTDSVAPGELTRGIYQCVKYRAVLRAMNSLAGELIHVQAVLVTPQKLPKKHQSALQRLGIKWQTVKGIVEMDAKSWKIDG